LEHFTNLKALLTQAHPPGDAYHVNFYLIRGLITVKNKALTFPVPE
jgi:hypothetical protein